MNGQAIQAMFRWPLGKVKGVITPPVALTRPVGQPKRATVNVNLPPSGVGIISALIDSVVPEP